VGLVSLLLGTVGGLGLVYVLDLLDDRFRSPEEMQLELGVPVLAMVGRLGPLETGGGIEDVHMFARPSGPECEAFRTLRTALAFLEGGVHRVVITSTEPGDGKTTIAANLGAACAQSGKRTLLIDADMRRPGLTPLLNLKGTRGLAALLRDPEPLARAVSAHLHSEVMPNLDVIPSGPRPLNPMELLAGDRFAELLAWAETAYEQIIVDSPPSLAVSDSAIIGRLVDGAVLVLRPEKNRRRLVARAAGVFASLGVRVLGLVLNGVESAKGHDYYGYGYPAYDYAYVDDELGDVEDAHGEPDDSREPPRKIVRRVG
jgi:capsular exopolysaccharide synthesis family protein